jgi:menaquinone-9 beta-reductase
MIETDVCIIGAGPGGAGTALKLSYMGIPCVLVDKAVFPRDKVCGDAVSGKVTTLLNRLDPAILQRFNAEPRQVDVWGIRFYAPNMKALDIPFEPGYRRIPDAAPGYVSKRIDFDSFLVEEVKRRDNIAFYENTPIEHYERTPSGYLITGASGQFRVHARLLVAADGAHSSFSRRHAGLEMDPRHHAGAVRAYFRNVVQSAPDNFIELHFIRSIVPGYFWIFPLPNGEANVGLGIRSDFISRRRFNLRKMMMELIRTHPELKERFRHAELIGEVKGYGLPLGSLSRPISGDHYMLVGDAGHLVDPLTGEGIGNALYSGFIAAEQARDCLEKSDFSAVFLKAYDQRVARVLGSEMKLSYRLQQMLRYPVFANIIAGIIAGNQKVVLVLSEMYKDFDLRQQLVRPVFWLKMLMKGKK